MSSLSNALHYAVADGIPRCSLNVALVVGSILNTINQGEAMLGHGTISWLKIAMMILQDWGYKTEPQEEKSVETARGFGGGTPEFWVPPQSMVQLHLCVPRPLGGATLTTHISKRGPPWQCPPQHSEETTCKPQKKYIGLKTPVSDRPRRRNWTREGRAPRSNRRDRIDRSSGSKARYVL